jgi:peptide/nickel transport system substrate-binding protein
MSYVPRLLALLLAVLVAAPVALAQSRAETLLVLVEFGPNSMDIHGVGANFRAYGASWNLYDRLLTYGTKTLADGSRSYDHATRLPHARQAMTHLACCG